MEARDVDESYEMSNLPLKPLDNVCNNAWLVDLNMTFLNQLT